MPLVWKRSNAMKAVVKVLVAYVAFSLVVGSLFPGVADQLDGRAKYGLCLMTFGSVVLLHFLTWQFIVGDSVILGRDPKAFFYRGQTSTFYTGLTTFGYVVLAQHCLRIAGLFPGVRSSGPIENNLLVYGLSYGVALIGIGMAVRLRLLFRHLQAKSE